MAGKLKAEDLSVEEMVGEGDIARVILDTAAEKGCDLICMTTHGFSGMERFIWGSVADKVAKASNVPLMLIRAIPVTNTAIEAEARVGV